MPEPTYPSVHTDHAVESLKTLPYSREAEQSVLGGLMLNNEAWISIADLLMETDFHLHQHQLLFRAIKSLFEQGHPCDPITLSEWLQKNKQLNTIGGGSYLGILATNTPSAANIIAYAEIVRERSILRQLVRVGTEIVESAFNPQGSTSTQLLDNAEKLVFDIAELGARGQKGFVKIDKVLTETLSRIDHLSQQEGSITGLSTGFTDFDNLTSGLQRSDLIIIAGRPSMGKCVASHCQIVLSNGSLVTIEEIYRRKQAQLLTLGPDDQFMMTEASDFIDDGIKPVFRVTTRLGRSIETTLTHPFLTQTGWQPLSEISVGDKIAVPKKIEVFGQKILTEYQIKLLAYLIGQGDLTGSQPCLTVSHPQIQKDFMEAVLEFGGIQAQLKSSTGRLNVFKLTEKNHKYTIPKCQKNNSSKFDKEAEKTDGLFMKKTTNSLTLWLEKLGLSGVPYPFIPSVIFQLQPTLLALFLNRLFTINGSAGVLESGQAGIGYSCVSEELIRQLQHLLLRFGIIASIKKRTIQCTKGWQLEITDAEYIQMFIDQIGFFSTEKSNLMPAIDKTIYNIFLLRRLKKTTANMTKRTIFVSNSSKRQTPYKKTRISLQLGKKIKKIKRRQQQYYWDEIKAIEPIGSKKVYDLTIPNTHNFVANDICVHNTSFAMNLAQHVAIKENIPVAVFSMEMSDEQLAMRLISSLAKINLQSVRTGKLNDDEWSKMTEAVSQLESAPLFIDQTPALSPNDLRARVRRLAREQGQLGLVVIDYLQLMQVPESKESRANEVSEISRSLKSLAKELNVPVIALSQLNRSLEQRSDRRPKMSDLRESGSIEQDSDLIAFIYRDEVYNEDSPDKNTAEIIIAKQRNGPIGTIRLYFRGNITQFENYTPNDSYYGE